MKAWAVLSLLRPTGARHRGMGTCNRESTCVVWCPCNPGDVDPLEEDPACKPLTSFVRSCPPPTHARRVDHDHPQGPKAPTNNPLRPKRKCENKRTAASQQLQQEVNPHLGHTLSQYHFC